MRRILTTLLTFLIALLVPALLVVNGVRVLANDWYIHFAYARPGFPPDVNGLTTDQRAELALTGLHSVLPQHVEGIDLLRQARLPDGSPAFNERELRHMHDVRALIGQLYPLHLAIAAAVVGLAIAFGRSGQTKRIVPGALRAGAILTLGLAAALMIYIVVNFRTFFTQFHQVFFEGETWLFQFTDTLIRLYPIPFWSDAAALIGGATVVQALVLWIGARRWLKQL